MERKRSVKRYGGRRNKRKFTDKCKDFIRNFIAFMFSNVGIIGLVVGYTIAGAFIFQAIEGQIVEDENNEMLVARNQTVERLWRLIEDENILDEVNWRQKTDTELRNYTWVVAEAIKNGFEGNEGNDNARKWSFPGAFLYSLTVITTIGYGNVSPKTLWGKLATILYAIAGMPLFLLYLSNIGDILARCFKWLYAKCCLCRWCPNVAKKREERRLKKQEDYITDEETGQQSHQSSPKNWQRRHAVSSEDITLQKMAQMDTSEDGCEEEEDEDEYGPEIEGNYDEYDPQTVTVPITICLTIMVGYVCGGALLFAEYEGWGFLDGSYFCFISLSTIGFGDIVPGENTYFDSKEGVAMSFVFCSMYLMLGMALIAMCFNLMQEEVIAKIRKILRTIKRIFR